MCVCGVHIFASFKTKFHFCVCVAISIFHICKVTVSLRQLDQAPPYFTLGTTVYCTDLWKIVRFKRLQGSRGVVLCNRNVNGDDAGVMWEC